jgi:hypothetical protein
MEGTATAGAAPVHCGRGFERLWIHGDDAVQPLPKGRWARPIVRDLGRIALVVGTDPIEVEPHELPAGERAGVECVLDVGNRGFLQPEYRGGATATGAVIVVMPVARLGMNEGDDQQDHAVTRSQTLLTRRLHATSLTKVVTRGEQATYLRRPST